LDEARGDDQRRDLRSHPPARLHRLSFLWRPIEETTAPKPFNLAIIAPRRIHSRPKGPIIVTWRVGELSSYAPAWLVYADVEPAAVLACFGGAFGRFAAAYQPSGIAACLEPSIIL
jgi:hypothetical protein